MKRALGIFAFLVVGLSVGLWLKVNENHAASRAPAGGNGVIEGLDVDISARLPGRITAVKVREGDLVKQGQVLVELDCREPRAAMTAASAQLSMARINVEASRAQVDAALGAARAATAAIQASGAQSRALRATMDATSRQEKRVRQLEKVGGVTAVELDKVSTQVRGLNQQLVALDARTRAARGQASAARGQAQAVRKKAEAAVAAVKAAAAGVSRARVAVEECSLRSPISGTVLTRAHEPGEVVLPGSRVLSVIRLEQVKTSFYLPNRELAAAAVGMRVTVKADAYPGQLFPGTIRWVSAEAEFTPRNVQTREDRDRLVYRVKVVIQNPKLKLRPGMPVEVSIEGTENSEMTSRKQAWK